MWVKKHKTKRALTRIMITHRILQRKIKRNLSARSALSLMVWLPNDVNADNLIAMHAVQIAHTHCFLTFSGLSGEASTKDWGKCTIPTFLFSQNLWHHEVGKVFRQSSYSPAGSKITGQWGQEGKGHSKGKWGGNNNKSDAQVCTWTENRKNVLQSMQTSRLIMQEHWRWKSRN